MTWRKVSDYAIQRGKQVIAKCYVNGLDALYVLTVGDERIGHFTDAQAAKDKADQLMERQAA